MTKKQSSEVSAPQQARSPAAIREDRHRRVTAILKYTGFAVAGGSSGVIIHQLLQGEVKNAILIGLITFAATILAIASK
ncbi:MAG: hypothetical protein AAF652_17740, partial [Cyanobacteria bacterium P01_C01_bin.72]